MPSPCAPATLAAPRKCTRRTTNGGDDGASGDESSGNDPEGNRAAENGSGDLSGPSGGGSQRRAESLPYNGGPRSAHPSSSGRDSGYGSGSGSDRGGWGAMDGGAVTEPIALPDALAAGLPRGVREARGSAGHARAAWTGQEGTTMAHAAATHAFRGFGSVAGKLGTDGDAHRGALGSKLPGSASDETLHMPRGGAGGSPGVTTSPGR